MFLWACCDCTEEAIIGGIAEGKKPKQLLKDNPKPSEAEVRHYLDGNICRCTGYHNIVKAIMAASGQDVSALAAE